ncbi:hypothetical protein NAPIS_ORF02316 [Vairimorpha apis BRL 01]|uniref:Uncharacterized protein n=1 Tax=Vairimorpha apis BRL 01 TaxID=1037528 RepID=T0L5X8_9MICR|nr:hypothetical protein NAPIS_ORF02316 [Vairimorpha apis BRL 01]
MVIFYIILNFCTNIPSETESDSSESNQESQYLTFTLNRILLNKKVYTYENASFCNITLFKLNEDITETFKYHYNILRNKIFKNDTLSLKNCEKLYFGNIATSILYRLDGFLKENRIDMLDKISLIFFDYNFKKNSIKRQTHENLQIGKDKESMVFNETAKGNKKRKLNIKEENMLTNYEEEKDWLIKEDNNQLNIKEESIITTDREEESLIKEENLKLNNEEEDMLTSDIECDLKKEETLLKKGKHLNFDIEEELHPRKKLKLIKKEENEDCIEKSNVKDKFKSNIKKIFLKIKNTFM